MYYICICIYICICNLYIRLSFHFIYDTDEEIRDFKIYFPIISKDMILTLLYPNTFKSFFDIYIYQI